MKTKDNNEKEVKLVNFLWRNQLYTVPEDKVQDFKESILEAEKDN